MSGEAIAVISERLKGRRMSRVLNDGIMEKWNPK